ncbi:hypothetical protein MHYP_G00059470 [Metynnis hypsauchen]
MSDQQPSCSPVTTARLLGKRLLLERPQTAPTYLVCPPFKTTSCSYNDGHGNSYDLSSLALHNTNWVVLPQTGSKDQRYYIKVCKSLVPQSVLASAQPCFCPLQKLSGKDYKVKSTPYEYHFAVCGPVNTSVCPQGDKGTVASCQVEGTSHRIAARLLGKRLLLERPQTAPTYLVCPPFKTTSCSYNDGHGNSYDLSSLALHNTNWVVLPQTGSKDQRYYIKVCKSLVPQSGLWGCPSSAAACQKKGDKYVSLGEVKEGLQWESDVLVLKYTDGASCPASDQKRTTIIRFKCDREKVDSKPTLITALEDCIYNFVWFTAAACPLNTTEHGDCRVTNPATGHLFDLNALTQSKGYTVYDNEDLRKMYRLNVCGPVEM